MAVPSRERGNSVVLTVYRNRTDGRDTHRETSVPSIVRRILPLLPILFILPALPSAAGEHWPQFRGPAQQGHTDSTGLPQTWSETQNVKFRTPIPGEGWSSPVVWSKQVWMTTATDGGHSLRAVCVDRDTGAIVHSVEVFRVEKLAPKNSFNSYPSPTPVLEAGRGMFLSAPTAKP